MFTLNMVDYPMSFLLMSPAFWWTCRHKEGTILGCSHSLSFPSCLKVRVVVGGVGRQNFCQPESLLVLDIIGTWLELGLGILGLRVWRQGLTIISTNSALAPQLLERKGWCFYNILNLFQSGWNSFQPG